MKGKDSMNTSIWLFALVTISVLCGCATIPRLSYTPEVRKMSYADNLLFKNLSTGIGSVCFVDEVMHPDATQRVIEKIEVITPYDNRAVGLEKWTINHGGESRASYLVELTPDRRGGTYFSVKKADK